MHEVRYRWPNGREGVERFSSAESAASLCILLKAVGASVSHEWREDLAGSEN